MQEPDKTPKVSAVIKLTVKDMFNGAAVDFDMVMGDKIIVIHDGKKVAVNPDDVRFYEPVLISE